VALAITYYKQEKHIQKTSDLFVRKMLSSLLKEHQAKQATKKETRGKIEECIKCKKLKNLFLCRGTEEGSSHSCW
jgi:hypothetical protein